MSNALQQQLDLARTHLTAASEKSNAATQAVDVAVAEAARLERALQVALEAEKSACEVGLGTPDDSAKVRECEDAIRRHGHRVAKLRTESVMCSDAYADAYRVQCIAQKAVAKEKVRVKADAYTAKLTDAAAPSKSEYYEAISEYRALLDTEEARDFRPDNVRRVVLEHTTVRLLQTELYSGKAGAGHAIRSAADILRDGDMPLLK